MRKQNGFTLIEIAIVLVIIGLLLGGVLKGQELITSARVRNLISQQDGIKAAYFGFLDRFRALPGDYCQATTNIAGAPRRMATTTAKLSLTVQWRSSKRRTHRSLWEHLSRAGFINSTWTCACELHHFLRTSPILTACMVLEISTAPTRTCRMHALRNQPP